MPQVEIIMPTKTLEETRPTRIAAYCRVSSNSDDQLNSFYAQVKYYTTGAINRRKAMCHETTTPPFPFCP